MAVDSFVKKSRHVPLFFGGMYILNFRRNNFKINFILAWFSKKHFELAFLADVLSLKFKQIISWTESN